MDSLQKKWTEKRPYRAQKLVLAGTQRERDELAVVVPHHHPQSVLGVKMLQQPALADQLGWQVDLLGGRQDHLAHLDHVVRVLLGYHGPREGVVAEAMGAVLDVQRLQGAQESNELRGSHNSTLAIHSRRNA